MCFIISLFIYHITYICWFGINCQWLEYLYFIYVSTIELATNDWSTYVGTHKWARERSTYNKSTLEVTHQ